MQLGTNRIGHFLFTNLVLSNVLRRGQATGRMRVVNVRRAEHKRDVRFDDLGFEVGISLRPVCFSSWTHRNWDHETFSVRFCESRYLSFAFNCQYF